MKNLVFDASTYTKYLRERTNLKLYKSDTSSRVSQTERFNTISRPPVQDVGSNSFLAIFSKQVQRFLVYLFAGNGTTGIPTDGQRAALSPLTSPRSVTINPTNTNQLIIGCANPSSTPGGNLLISVNISTGVLTRFGGTGFVASNTISGDGIISAATANTTHVTYTITSGHAFTAGQSVRVVGLSVAEFNMTGIVDSPTATSFRIAATGLSGSSHTGNNGTAGLLAVNAQLSAPHGGVFDSFGNYYWSDQASNVIRRIDTNGYISRYAGGGGGGFDWNNLHRLNTTTALKGVRGLTIDANNNIYLADTDAYRVRKIDYSTGMISTLVGTGTNQATSQGTPTDGGTASAEKLRSPTSLAFDKSYENLYILDFCGSAVSTTDLNGVYRYNIADGKIYIIHQSLNRVGQFDNPRAIALNNNGDIYIGTAFLELANVQRINASTGEITLYAGGGRSNDYSNVDRQNAQFYNIFGMCFDSNGTLYIANSGGITGPNVNRILTVPNTSITDTQF